MPVSASAKAQLIAGTQQSNRLWKDRYLIVGELGRGGIGVVYLAQDEQLLSKRVVIKVLLDETHLDVYLQKKFQQEIEALARIDHPGIVGLLDAGETPDNKPFLVMQYVEGVTLRSELVKGVMDFRRLAEIIRQVGQALGAAHEKGIFHRDLKPENIMIARRNETEEYAKLIDFGIAAVRDSRVASGAEGTKVVGTPLYMAPEQVLGRASAASDIYSLAVVIFEMLTGRRPAVSASGLGVKPRELRTEIPEAAEAILLRALSLQPDRRPASARQFAEQFARALLHDNTSATRSPGVTQKSSGTAAPVLETNSGELEMANVLFMDIVGYSKLEMGVQSLQVQQLQEIVRATSEFQRAQHVNQLVSIPTGDGMALVFFHNPVAPVKCAVEIAHALSDFPDIRLRMGVHTGLVHRISDINANRNVAGGGINMAQRVMDCGDAGHILLSRTVADIVGQLPDWASLLRDLGEAEVKHGKRIGVVNLCADGAGNPTIPERLRGRRQGSASNPALVSTQLATRTRIFPAFDHGSIVLSLLGMLVMLVAGLLAIHYVSTTSTAGTISSRRVSGVLPPVFETTTGAMVLISSGADLHDNQLALLDSYYIDRTEVTNLAFSRFCVATKSTSPACISNGPPEFPVVNVTIEEARKFALWAGKRLPTHAEWEKAARAVQKFAYPWDNDPHVWEFLDDFGKPTAEIVDAFRRGSGMIPLPTSTEAWVQLAGGAFQEPAIPAQTVVVPARFRAPHIGFRLVRDAR